MLFKFSLILLFLHGLTVCFIGADWLYYLYLILLTFAFISSKLYESRLEDGERLYFSFFGYCILFYILAEIVSSKFIPYKFPHLSDPFYLFDTFMFFCGLIVYLRLQGVHKSTLILNTLFWIACGALLSYEFFIKPYGFFMQTTDLGQLIYAYSDLTFLLLLTNCLRFYCLRDVMLFTVSSLTIVADILDFYYTVRMSSYPLFFTAISTSWVLGTLCIVLVPKKYFKKETQVILEQAKILLPCLIIMLVFYIERLMMFEGYL